MLLHLHDVLGDRTDQVLQDDLAQYRWARHGKMFLLRHHVWKMSQTDSSTQYEKITYVREDNHFWAVPPIAAIATRLGSSIAPIVVTDDFCEFAGVNDKIFFVNAQGGELLFGRITALLHYWFNIAFNKRWIHCFDTTGVPLPKNIAPDHHMSNNQAKPSKYDEATVVAEALAGKIHADFDFLRTEEFLSSYLQETGASLARENLHRIDLRYFEAQRCVPSMYHHCASTHGGGYPACPGTTVPYHCTTHLKLFQNTSATVSRINSIGRLPTHGLM